MVVLVVGSAPTAGNCTAFHLLDTSRLTVEVVADILARSSGTGVVAAVAMISVGTACY
jgi:hypothetical protein